MGHVAKFVCFFNGLCFKFYLFSSVLGLHCCAGYGILVAVLKRYSLDVLLLVAVTSLGAEHGL